MQAKAESSRRSKSSRRTRSQSLITLEHGDWRRFAFTGLIACSCVASIVCKVLKDSILGLNNTRGASRLFATTFNSIDAMKKIICPSCSAEADSAIGRVTAAAFSSRVIPHPLFPQRQCAGLRASRTLSGLSFRPHRIQWAVFHRNPFVPETHPRRSRLESAFDQSFRTDLDEGQDMVLITDRGSPDQALNDAKGIDYSGGSSMCNNK